MSGLSEEALRKLNKDELIIIIQEQYVQHERHEERMKNLFAEVRKLTSSFAKGMPPSVHQNQLEDSVFKIFDRLNCNIVKDNLEDCHHLKGYCVIVKFSKGKDCKKVLSVKNDLKNINMADLGFEGNGSIYINESLYSYYKMLWSLSKKLHNMGRI